MDEVVLLDTNIVSFVFKKDTRREAYQQYLQNRILAVSFMTVAELYQWAAVHKWGQRRLTDLEMTLQKYVILPYDIETCRQWGNIRAVRQDIGHPIQPEDAWIAATAMQHRLPLVTHNPKDFGHINGLTILTTIRF